MASYGGLHGILTGLTKSTDHPSTWFLLRNRTLPQTRLKGPDLRTPDSQLAPFRCSKRVSNHVHIQIYACMYICMYVLMYIGTYICI